MAECRTGIGGCLLRLNVGSGQRPFSPPWINIDCQPKWKPDVVADGANMPVFETGSADMIVLHHVLEHFGCGEADALIKECRRILVPGGSLLVFVPDMWKLTQGWREGRIDDQIFMTCVYGAYMGDPADRHAWGFSSMSLRRLLWSTGFERDRVFNGRSIPGADIARDWWILGIEAIR